MGNACRLALLVWVVVCCCASRPALAQGRRAGPSSPQEPPPVYILQTEEEARLRAGSAEQSDRLSRVEGRLDGIEEATTRAAAAGEKAAGAAEGTIATVRWCTSIISVLIFVVGGALGFLGYRELKGIQAVREQAEQALKKTARKADEAVKQASECAAAAAESLAEVQQSEKRVRALLESAEEMRGEIADRREKVTVDATVVADLRKQVEAGAKIDPTKDVLAEEREALEDASRAADRLEELGEKLTPEAHLARGHEYLFQEDYERALAEYDQVVRLKPDSAKAYYSRAMALRRLHRREQALAEYDPAVDLKSYYTNAHDDAAMTRERLGRDEEALKAFERAIDLKPDFAFAHHNRGMTLLDLDRPDEALAAFDRAIALRSGFGTAHYRRACAYSRLGNRDEALRDLKRAIELDEHYRESARTDEDFEGLREDAKFRRLVGMEGEGGD